MELILVAAHRALLWLRKVARDLEWRARLRCPRCSRGVTALGRNTRSCMWGKIGYFR